MSAAPAFGQVRVVNWNVLRGETSFSNYEAVLRAITDYEVNDIAVAPGVVTLQETDALVSSYFASTLESITGDDYAWSNAGGNLPVGIVYNASAYDLVGSATVSGDPRPARRFDLRPKGYASEDAVFSVYSFHLKAGGGASDFTRRADTAEGYRENADALRPGADELNVLYTGDFNVRGSNEGGFGAFTAAGGRARADDPVQRYGTYKNNSSFRDVHTHSTGEIDDRFDLQLVSLDALDGEGFSYIGPRGDVPPGTDHSYTVVGNSGNLYNRSVLSSTDPQLSSAEKSALRHASDHLPVFADYQLPARLEVRPAARDAVLLAIQGASVSLDYEVINAAPVVAAAGADELDYTFAGTGIASGSGGGSARVGTPGAASLSLDTSAIGAFAAGVEVTSDSEAVDDGLFSHGVTVAVLGPAEASLSADTADAEFLEIDFGRVVRGSSAATREVPVFNAAVADLQAPLAIAGVERIGDDSFTLAPAGADPIFVGSSGVLDLLFAAEALGEHEAIFRVSTTDDPSVLGASSRDALFIRAVASVAGSRGDLDLDGDTDVVDLDLFADSLLSGGDDLLGDLDGDGVVNVVDLDLFADDLLAEPPAAAGLVAAAFAPVPEPPAAAVLTGFVGLVAGRRRPPA